MESTIKPSEWNPTSIGLPETFRLTDYSKLKGCGCKIAREKLLQYLDGISSSLRPNEAPGMDSSVVATKYPGIFNISTTDFFSPLVEDPYLQGRIAACNVISDLYAMAVTEIDTILMMLGSSLDMAEADRDIVAKEMIRGFNDVAHEAGTSVTGGHSIMNPWPLIGGVAMSIRHESEFIRPEGIKPGAVLVLTKPLGTQVAVNCWQWRRIPKYWTKIESSFTVEMAATAYDAACASMRRMNLNGAKLMHKYHAQGGTDVTGFGILGHATNLATHQHEAVRFELTRLPIIKNMLHVDSIVNMFRLRQGFSSETSGGLLCALPTQDAAEAYIKELTELDGFPAWIVGRVVPFDASAAGSSATTADGASSSASASVEEAARAIIVPDVEIVEV